MTYVYLIIKVRHIHQKEIFMKEKRGIVASYVDVVFKKDGKEILRTSGSIGCVRYGQPEDDYSAIREALGALEQEPDFTSVVVGNFKKTEYTREELVGAGVVIGWICGTKPPVPKPPQP